MSVWVPSPNYYFGRKAPLLWVVWHSTESAEVKGAAMNVGAGWFGQKTSKVSAHVVVDNGADARYPDGVVECVKPGDTAWHAASANASGYGVEIVGKATQSGADWTDPYSLAAVRNAARWIRSNPALSHIPSRWLTDTQLRNREQGHVVHAQVTRVLGGTTHTDPGPNFPFAYAMEQLGAGVPSEAHEPPVTARTTLRMGYTGQNVSALQAGLNRAFPSYSHLTVDGDFGPATESVVKEFQGRVGLTADGVVGPATWAKLGQYGI
jgi:N-acetyl-anhydromuramyl-L-alanine amidase AmpD